MRSVIEKHRKEWIEHMTELDFEINRIIYQLDDMAVGYERRWGVNRLEALAPSELGLKWERQLNKLNDAIEAKDIHAIRQLAAGMGRAYKALEESALGLGHKPHDAVYWEVSKGSKIYRIVKNVADARALHNPDKDNIIIATVEELVNLYCIRHEQAFGERPKITEPKKEMFDFNKGDEIGF